MQCGNIASHTNIGQDVYTEYTRTLYILHRESTDSLINILGECSALWGERERVVWCIIVFHSTSQVFLTSNCSGVGTVAAVAALAARLFRLKINIHNLL